jgi:hypothetical protein
MEKANSVDLVIHHGHFSGATSSTLRCGILNYGDREVDKTNLFIMGFPSPNLLTRPVEGFNAMIGMESPLSSTVLFFDNQSLRKYAIENLGIARPVF